MVLQRVDLFWQPMARDVGGRNAGDLLQRRQPPHDQVVAGKAAGTEHAIDPFASQVDVPVTFAEEQLDAWI
jgi:hypothetical protein